MYCHHHVFKKSCRAHNQGWYNTVRVMYYIVPIQYCNVMYCIPNFPDKVLFVHRSYVPRVCSYSVLVYNLQMFAKIIFCLIFFFWIPFVLYLFNLVDDIINDVHDNVISDITDDVIMHDVISDVSHHTAPKTNVSHPHPQGQATQIQTAVHTRWLSKLTCSSKLTILGSPAAAGRFRLRSRSRAVLKFRILNQEKLRCYSAITVDYRRVF